MRVCAENHFFMTRALFTEGMLLVWKKQNGKSLGILGGILLICWVAFSIFTLWSGGGVVLPLMELMVALLAAGWAGGYLPRRKAARAFRELTQKGSAESERITCFYEDQLTVEVDGEFTNVKYAEISQILTSRHLLVLLAGNGKGILVDRGGFTVGSETELRLILEREKRR